MYLPYFQIKVLPPYLPTAYAITEPITQPIAPASAVPKRVNCPLDTKYPENGIMISLGSGMHADSIAIIAAMPAYPNVLIAVIMNVAQSAIIFPNIGALLKGATNKTQ